MGGWNRSPPGSAGVGELEAPQQLIHAAQISLPVIFCHLSRETGAFWELGGLAGSHMAPYPTRRQQHGGEHIPGSSSTPDLP